MNNQNSISPYFDKVLKVFNCAQVLWNYYGSVDGGAGGSMWIYWHLYVIFNRKKVPFKKIGPYRDDGLAAFKNVSGPASEKIKIIKIECNLKVVNYLDVTFNLNDGSYPPYRKPNDETHYIHIQSDHPSSITKQLPRSSEKRLSQLSSSKDIFYETVPY